jgi:hypothetical protein
MNMNRKKRIVTIVISLIVILFSILYYSTSVLCNNLLINISGFSTIDHKVYFSPLINQSKKDSITDLLKSAIHRNILFWGRREL